MERQDEGCSEIVEWEGESYRCPSHEAARDLRLRLAAARDQAERVFDQHASTAVYALGCHRIGS